MIVNAEGNSLGRLATYVAKQALLGRNVIVVNAEKAVVSGKRESVIEQYSKRLERRSKGSVTKGPYHQKRPDRFVRRTIRGMLPLKKSTGREAYGRVMVYIGIPKDEIKKKHRIDVGKEKMVELKKKETNNNVTVAEICKSIGGEW